jgi:hypothetical protein
MKIPEKEFKSFLINSPCVWANVAEKATKSDVKDTMIFMVREFK